VPSRSRPSKFRGEGGTRGPPWRRRRRRPAPNPRPTRAPRRARPLSGRPVEAACKPIRYPSTTPLVTKTRQYPSAGQHLADSLAQRGAIRAVKSRITRDLQRAPRVDIPRFTLLSPGVMGREFVCRNAGRIRRYGGSRKRDRGAATKPRPCPRACYQQLQDRQEFLDLVRCHLHAVGLELLALELEEAGVGVLAERLVQELGVLGLLDRLSKVGGQ
jgi:hypothetical protein